jgi:nicotinamide-nucleotide amidase
MTAEDTPAAPSAAIVTVGTELVEGLRLDTNSREIASALCAHGYRVRETRSIGDEIDLLARALQDLLGEHDLVVVTGGLGPTHDDITREAAALALGVPLEVRPELLGRLEKLGARHRNPAAQEQVLLQAYALTDARVIEATSGTAPGQVATASNGAVLLLLPGPPHELRPMLAAFLEQGPASRPRPRQLSCVGISESDAQVKAAAALVAHSGVALTVLASPGLVSVVLIDDGADEAELEAATTAVSIALGPVCYSTTGESLAATVIRSATEKGITIATAESCTGGLVSAALTSVPGSSQVFLGGLVTYSDETKSVLAGVSADTLQAHGAVSAETARELASGVRERLGADIAVAVTGIAGPSGGSADKPVGLVWFAVETPDDSQSEQKHFFGDRDGVRERATVFTLNLLRRTIERM